MHTYLCGTPSESEGFGSTHTTPHRTYTDATDQSESSVRSFFYQNLIQTKTSVATKTNQRETQRPRGEVKHHIVHNSFMARKNVCCMSREASDYTSISLVLPRNLVKKPLKGLSERTGKARTRGAVEIRVLAHKVSCNACKLS